jgi:hypothetical protein
MGSPNSTHVGRLASTSGGGNSNNSSSSNSSPDSSSLCASPATATTAAATALSYGGRRFCVIMAALIACVAFVPEVLHINAVHATTSLVTCPYGWSLYEAADSAAGTTTTTRQCVRVFASAAVPASAAKTTCATIFSSTSKVGEASQPLSADGVTPWPFTRYVSPHGAAIHSADENTFMQNLFLRLTDNGLSDDIVLILGGVAGYGLVDWYADTTSATTYTNFAADTDWQLHAGTVVMRPDGEWGLLPADSTAAATAYPFACAFDASRLVTIPDSSSQQHHGSSSAGPVTTTSSSSSQAAHAGSSSSNAAHHGNRRAHRPAVPQPAPACLDGWTPLPTYIDTSDGAANTVCYLLFTDASEVGGRRGKTFAAAQAYCSAAHPKATLASVMSREENEWVVSALLSAFPSTGNCACDGASPMSASSTKSSRTVFLGGSYMRDGTGAGLIGSWYADQYLFNASEYAATSPSSPAWPTESNDYYANWSRSEPLLSYGVVGITPPPESCNCAGGNGSTSPVSSAAGAWVGVDPRSTQPFLCSYLNDGSTFPPSPPTTTPSPDSNSPPAPGPSEHCIPDWSYLELTNSCYRVYPTLRTSATSASTTSTTTITAATMEEECEQVLRGRVVAAKVGHVRAVSMLSIAESNYVGALLQSYLEDPVNSVVLSSANSSNAVPVSLAGISFIDSGESGFYISGVRELDPQLALSLWATAEPASVKGCIAVDVKGLWYYVPCSTYTSPSMPDNAAVLVEAFTCQYSANDIDPAKDLLPDATTTPESTSGPGWSSESDSGSDDSTWLPLSERVTALSGATHVVVAAGSTGIYALQGPKATTPVAASTRGLHFYFAPLSAYYTYAAPTTSVDGTAIGSVFAPAQSLPTSIGDLLALSPNASVSRPFAPCEGYKDQSRIFRVRRNTLTVHHSNTSEVGYVCVSQDGKTYVPTAITYEVTEVTVQGFIPAPDRTLADPGTRPTWLPPLFCSETSSSSAVCAVQRTLAIPEHGTGTVQLALRYSSSSGSDVVFTAQSPHTDTMVSHVRLSATPNCMGPDVPFYFLASEIALKQVPVGRYTRRRLAVSSDSAAPDMTAVYSIFSYQYAAVRAARFSALKPLFNSSNVPSQLATLQPPVEYYVCVAMQKTNVTNNNTSDSDDEITARVGAASRRLLSLWNVSSSNSSRGVSGSGLRFTNSTAAQWSSASSSPSSSENPFNHDAFLLSIAERLAARTSLSPTGAAVRTYTAVPGLKVHIVPAPVSIKGMWALPPRRLTQRAPTSTSSNSSGINGTSVDLATLVPTPATFNRSAHYRLRPTYAYTYGDAKQPSHGGAPLAPIASAAHLHIPQYSSPVVLLDGHDIQPGMLALLSQDPNSCNRLQPTPRNDPTAAASSWPPYLDTMVPLSTVSMRVEDPSMPSGNTSSSTATVAYMQLNLNHTGLWGHHPTRTDDVAAMEQTWYVCLAYSPLSPFIPLHEPALKITVHRLHVKRFAMDASAAFTSSDAVAAAEAADASTTHLNLNTGFAGMLWMHGVDVRLWATTTLHSAQVALSVVLPSSGTPDDTAAQCAHSTLFYSQQGLGLLTQDSRRSARHMNSSSSQGQGGTERDDDDDDVDTSVGMVIPLGFFTRQSTRRMQLCLSVPLPFTPTTGTASAATAAAGGVVPQHRIFAPLVNTTLDVRPIQLLYVGRYSAIPTSAITAGSSGTVVRLAEGTRDVVLPLTGYGIRPDMTMFLSSRPCHGVTTTATTTLATPSDADRIVVSQSLLNISVVSLYDLPSSYWNVNDDDDADDDDSGRAHRPRVFVVLRHDDLLRKAAAQRLFRQNITIDPFTGLVTTTRVPLNVCLYAPGTATLVFPTDFQLVVDPPRVTAIRNVPSDAALIARAAAGMPAAELAALTPTAATVVYAASMDLIVEGFGLDDTNTWLMPAVDCSNASSFLWRAPVKLSALPSSQTTSVRIEKENGKARNALYANSSRFVDPQTSYASWFASLQEQETVRVGADTAVSSGQVVRRFQWCVRIAEDDDATTMPFAETAAAVSSTTTTTAGYVATRIPYQLMLPTVDGFALENARRGAPPSTALILPTQHPTKGRWFSLRLVGSAIDVVHAIGTPLYMFLAPEAYSCHDVKNAYLHQGLYSFGNASFAAVNGSAVLLPRWLATAGSYRLCASAVYPTLASADEGIEAALQFFTLDGLRVQLIQAVYGVFALNHTTTVTVEQGQEWTLPISGSMLTNRSLIRFHTSAEKCGEPMVATKSAGGGVLPDILIQNDFTGFSLFGQDDESSELEGGTSVVVNGYYVVLSQHLIRSLAAPASYVLCLQPQRSLAWRAAPSITLHVVKHVRRPTHYNYFPADGSEDVAALTALAPTKVALDWNTGEENMVNIVGAAGQQVSLALWCLPTPNVSTLSSSPSSFLSNSSGSSSNSSAIGVAEELVPCGDHRRVMFVKPLDNDEDPCFVDAEAVTDDVLRGPFVLDFGVLTLPHSLSVMDSTTGSLVLDGSGNGAPLIIPNMTQPWIMCLETGPERWREPTYPMLQLQYTRAIPTGFRLSADDASNTTAPFPAHKPDVEATTTAEVDSVTGMPLGGNTTLLLYAQDSSQVVYLNGYGIERGHKLRFGSLCEEEMVAPLQPAGSASGSGDGSDSNSGTTTTEAMAEYLARVSERQSLVNVRLYTEPLMIEDDNGVFLVPSTHILEAENRRGGTGDGIPVCLSTNDGYTYKKTSLSLRVLPSRLKTDTETQYRNLLDQILSNTLLVPQHSRGSVDLSELVKVAKGVKDQSSSPSSDSTIATASGASGSYDNGNGGDSLTTPSPTPAVYVRIGTQVLLSASCSVNTHGLPLLTVNVPNVITLTKQHTAVVTAERLLLCFRNVDAAASAAAGQSPDANNTENEVGAVTAAFLWYGLYYRVLGVQVDQVSLHPWTPTDAMKADNINHVVLRRGAEEDLLLPVLMEAKGATAVPLSEKQNSDLSPEDELLQRIERSPSAMSFLSLTRFYVGRPCFRSATAPKPAAAISPYVSSYAGMQLNFSADAVTVAPLSIDQRSPSVAAASLNRTLVAALPSGDSLTVPQFPLEMRGSVCLSVDGGLRYLAVGIAQYTEDWAATLRVTLDVEDNENNEDVAEVDDGDDAAAVTRGTTTAMHVYAQSSTTRRVIDTRFVNPHRLTNASGSVLQVLADLGQLTTTMLWSGFIGDDGFAMDGLLYLPAASKLTQNGAPQQQPQPLYFSLDNRLQNVPTNLSLKVVPWSLTCYGTTTQQDVFVRQQDIGLYASTAPGVCSAGVRDGARVRVVPLSAAACNDPAVVDTVYLMDLLTVQPGAWGVVTNPASSSSSSGSPFRAMQLPMALRYVPEGTYALCLRQDLPFVSTLTQPSTAVVEEEDTSAISRALYTAIYAPTPLRLHVSYNWTILSISGATISDAENTNNRSNTAAPTAVSSVVAVTQSSNAELPVRGTAVDVHGVPLLLAFAPSVAQNVTRRRLRQPGSSESSNSSAVTERWTWSNGCAGVPASWDPETGASLLVHSTSSSSNGATTPFSASSPSGKLLSAPWYNAQGGVWRVDAEHLQAVDWLPQQPVSSNTTATRSNILMRYTVCYSVDGGLTFHPAGVPPESASAVDTVAAATPFMVVVVPPTITALSASRAVAPGVEATPNQLSWSADEATATSVRVQLLFTTAAADAALTATSASIPRVTSYSRVDNANTTAYATRPQSYEYAWTGAFVGNGVGAVSGRALPQSPAAPSTGVPTVAAAVALVRTSLHGAHCDDVNAESGFLSALSRAGSREGDWNNASTASVLAAPIFVVNLQHGGVWSSADTDAVAAWRRAQTSNASLAAFDQMNVVLSREDWVNDTAAMWEAEGDNNITTNATTPLNGPLLLGRASTAAIAAARSNGESILVCLSTDGSHFYSAAVARKAFTEVTAPLQQSVAVSAATTSSVAAAQVSPWPLYLRARVPSTTTTTTTVADGSPSANAATTTTPAPLWMRETAMVMELLARPANTNTTTDSNTTPSLPVNADTLTRFQAALATQLGVDAAVVIVQLARSGSVALPQTNTSATASQRGGSITTRAVDPPRASHVSGMAYSTSPVVDSVLVSAIEAVQARHRAQASAKLARVLANTATSSSAMAQPQQQNQQQLFTYALVVSVAADAVAYNATSQTSTLTASPDLLYRTVLALCSNVTGPALLSTIVTPPTTLMQAATVVLHPLTVNFTMSNGVDLHTATATMHNALPIAPAQEVVWRDLFLSIPYAVVAPAVVPDAIDNDTTSKVSWWVIPVLLILPAGMAYGTYYVYKKYLKKSPEADTQVTIENAQ